MNKKRVYKHSAEEARMPGGMLLLVAFINWFVFRGASQGNYFTPWNQDNWKSKITFRHLTTHIYMLRLSNA